MPNLTGVLTDESGKRWTVSLAFQEAAEDTSPPQPEPEPSPRCMLGLHVPGDASRWYPKPAIIRQYHQWEMPNRRTEQYLDEGFAVMVSHKPPVVRGGTAGDGWKRVARGEEDQLLTKLADFYGTHAGRVIFIFHHEPHDDDPQRGNDYVAAFRKVANVMRSRGVSVGYCGTTTRVERSDTFYPGDSWVDVECHDPYNWYLWGASKKWREPAYRLDRLVALAERRGHPLILGEVNSHPGDETYSRKQWYEQLVEYAKTHPTLQGFCLYNTVHEHDWRIKTSELSAFEDPYLTSTPLPLPCGPVLEPGGPND